MARRKYTTEQRYLMCHLFEDRGLTPGQIGVRLGLTSDQVAGVVYGMGCKRGDSRRMEEAVARQELAVLRTHERIRWAYPPKRAEAIIAGRDPVANADLSSWRSLGRGGEEAA